MTTGKIGLNHVNVQAQSHRGDGYQVTKHQNYNNQRTTTNQQHIGGGSSQGQGVRTYNAAYAQQNNVNKTYELHANQGNMSLFNHTNNVEIKRDEGLFNNNRGNVAQGGPSIIPSTEFMGQVNGIQTYDNTFNNARMDQSLLSAFKNNPYTGIGISNYQTACLNIEKYNKLMVSYDCASHPHNTYIQWLSEGGLISFVAFILFLLMVIYLIFTNSNSKNIKFITLACILIMFWPIMSTGSLIKNWNGILTFYIIGVCICVNKIKLN